MRSIHFEMDRPRRPTHIYLLIPGSLQESDNLYKELTMPTSSPRVPSAHVRWITRAASAPSKYLLNMVELHDTQYCGVVAYE